MTNAPLLTVDAVSKRFTVGSLLSGTRAYLRAVDRVSFTVQRGETLALVGESGCGKSTLGRCLLRLIEPDEGRIVFDGIDVRGLAREPLRALRPRMQMVFQDPYGSLNPRRTVGDLIAEPLRVHKTAAGTTRTSTEISDRVNDLLNLVGLRRNHLQRYPHEFSGGQRQRIGIARALALNPDLIIADEPVSALDVSVQAQVINLMMDLQESLGLTYIFVAHDLAVVRQIATRTAVMYLGGIVEIGRTDTVFEHPSHPYTAALLAAVPRLAAASGTQPTRHLVRGEVPSPIAPPPGCRFHPRCPRAEKRCREEKPELRMTEGGGQVACHFPLSA